MKLSIFKTLFLALSAVMMLGLSGCGTSGDPIDEGIGGTPTPPIETVKLVGVQVSPANTYVLVGESEQFTATAVFSDGTTEDVTATAIWNISDKSIAVINDKGTATGISVGSVTLAATYVSGGIEQTGAAELDVLADEPTFKSLEIDGSDIVSIGLTDQLEAIATLSDGSTYNVNDKVNWTSSNPAMATVDALGVVTGVVLGDVTITATAKNDNSIVATHNMTVTDATLVSIQIENSYNPDTPQPITTLDVPITTEKYITAWGIYSDGSRHYINTDTIWWSEDQQIASINFLKSSKVYGRDLGKTTVTAYYGGLEASISVTVINNGPTLTAITLEINGGIDVTGGTIDPIPAGFETWVTAYGNYSDGTTRVNINRHVAYSSDKPEVAYVIDAIDSNIRGRSAGSAVITAEWQGVSATVTAPVIGLNTIEIQEGCGATETPRIDAGNPLNLIVPEEQCINAWGNYSDGIKRRVTTVVFWKSQDQSIASMDILQRDSKVSSEATGSTTVSAALVDINGTAPVNVVGIDTIEIQKGYVADGSGEVINSANPLNISIGDVFYITAWGNYSDGVKRYINTDVFWKSDNNDIASMPILQTSSNVTGESVGSTEVSATLKGVIGSAPVNVAP